MKRLIQGLWKCLCSFYLRHNEFTCANLCVTCSKFFFTCGKPFYTCSIHFYLRYTMVYLHYPEFTCGNSSFTCSSQIKKAGPARSPACLQSFFNVRAPIARRLKCRHRFQNAPLRCSKDSTTPVSNGAGAIPSTSRLLLTRRRQ